MAIGAIAAAVAPSIIGGIFSAFGASQQNKAAKKAAEAQMNFQREMYGSRYQMTMKDMRAAGLNPILAYKQGVGSSPGGSSYSPVNVGAGAGAAAGQAVSSAIAVRRQNQELKNMKQQNMLIEQQRLTEYTKQTLNARAADELYQREKQYEQQIKIGLPAVTAAKIRDQYLHSGIGRGLHTIGQGRRDLGINFGGVGAIVKGRNQQRRPLHTKAKKGNYTPPKRKPKKRFRKPTEMYDFKKGRKK